MLPTSLIELPPFFISQSPQPEHIGKTPDLGVFRCTDVIADHLNSRRGGGCTACMAKRVVAQDEWPNVAMPRPQLRHAGTTQGVAGEHPEGIAKIHSHRVGHTVGEDKDVEFSGAARDGGIEIRRIFGVRDCVVDRVPDSLCPGHGTSDSRGKQQDKPAAGECGERR
jgi:hypothetical protein